MIEELQDFLIRHGMAEGYAEDAHDAYYYGDMEGVRAEVEKWADGEHDYVDEVIALVRRWQAEVGETPT